MKFITAVLFFLAIFSAAPFDARADGAMKVRKPCSVAERIRDICVCLRKRW